MGVILVQLVAPFREGRATIFELHRRDDGEVARVPVPAADPDADLADHVAALVEAGAEQAIIDLDALATPDADEVARITAFVWSILAAGARPVVVAGDRDTADVVRHYKMDRAFEIFADVATALDRLDAAT